MIADADDFVIVEGVVGLANAFGRTVLAEGVETITHGELLLALGCELGQGLRYRAPHACARCGRMGSTVATRALLGHVE